MLFLEHAKISTEIFVETKYFEF